MKEENKSSFLANLQRIRSYKASINVHQSVSLDVHAIMTLETFFNQHTLIEHLDHLNAIMVNHKKIQ